MARTPRRLDDFKERRSQGEIQRAAMERDLEDRAREVPQRREDRDELDMRTGSSRGDMTRFQQASRASVDKLVDVVNDPNVTVDAAMMKTINDPSMVMLPSGEIAKVMGTSSSFSQTFRSRATKKRKKNPKLARAMKEANARGRKKNGGFKKGYDQARIARLAQKILKRMK